MAHPHHHHLIIFFLPNLTMQIILTLPIKHIPLGSVVTYFLGLYSAYEVLGNVFTESCTMIPCTHSNITILYVLI